MIIEIIGEGTPEPEAVGKAVQAAIRYTQNLSDYRVVIYTEPRRSDGWIEYIVNIRHTLDGKRAFTIGVLQRTVDGEWESHS